jgi:hypothetical protein
MHLWAKWMLGAVLPLLLAASKSKRKPVRRKAKRPVLAAHSRAKRPRAEKRARPSNRSPRRAPRGKQVVVRTRPPQQTPSTSVVAARPAAPEPPPKPTPPIGRAILLSPENDKFADSLHPTFRWLSVGGATRYEVAWSEDVALAASHTLLSIATEATVPEEEALRLGGMYYWRVRGGNESGWGPWSALAAFRVLEELT